ncbi:MAG: hypothetical protein IKR76_09960 [Ruminococcus sp.]|nr:hypothetical protein [Ruminococcus sp.]
MKHIKILAVLSAAVLLCSCNGKSSSSETVDELMSQANEINQTEADEYACLPDTVRLDDMYTRELEPQDGNISYGRLGVTFKLPDGYNAYIYEQNDEKRLDDERKAADKEGRKPKEIKTNEPNKTCMAAIFLVNGNFPHSHEFVRVGYSTSIAAQFQPLSWWEEHPEYGISPIQNKADFVKLLKSDIDKLTPAFIANEGLDAYNYTGLDASHREWLELGINTNDAACIPEILNVFNTANVFREPADDSSVSEIKCESVELDSGYLGVKLTYDIKRNGIAMDKEVYWLLDPDAQEDICYMRRVEFSKDKGAVWLTPPETFLKDFKITTPDYANKQDPTDYFGIWQIEITE